ncbi:MAG: hypothetical protein ACOY3Y_03720, partial [Acidobacteriota bacterium]
GEPPTCSGPSEQSCPIANGTGKQSRTCQAGVWSAWGACTVVSCDPGYQLDAGKCSPMTCAGPTLQSCPIANGKGTQSRSCLSGVWSAWGACTLASCNAGFEAAGNACGPLGACDGFSARACTTSDPNAFGVETRPCVNKVWGAWSGCKTVACKPGYTYNASTSLCVALATLKPDYTVKPDLDATGQTLTFTLTATIPAVTSYQIASVTRDGVAVVAPFDQALKTPSGSFSLTAATGAFSWRPTPSQAGFYRFAFVADDGKGKTEVIQKTVLVTMPVVCDQGSCGTLNADYLAGKIAGHFGDWYHNLDNFHASISVDYNFPQADLLKENASLYAGPPYEGWVTIGNASKAYTSGTTWSSLLRMAMFSEYTVKALYKQYITNHHYWYPEHQDHDTKDQYHGALAYVGTSQGSSGSEVNDLIALVRMLGYFAPEVKERLKRDRYRVTIAGQTWDVGLLMPTVQMIYRRSTVASDAEYLTAKAHPSAFDNTFNATTMNTMASAMKAGELPPMVQLEVVSESYGTVGGKNEKLFTTPASICRIFRDTVYTKTITVDAQKSFDLNGRALSFHWVVLRGDPAKVRITPLNAAKSSAKIEIDYHAETTIAGSTRLTNLVEVGVFVHNGVYYSAPGFVTDFTLANETRVYDAAGKLVSNTPNTSYVHPYLL